MPPRESSPLAPTPPPANGVGVSNATPSMNLVGEPVGGSASIRDTLNQASTQAATTINPMAASTPAVASTPVGATSIGAAPAVPAPAMPSVAPVPPASGGSSDGGHKPSSPGGFHWPHGWRLAAIITAITLLVLALLGWVVFGPHKQQDLNTAANTSNSYKVTNYSLSDLAKNGSLTVDSSQQLAINGQLRVNNSLVITPSAEPTNPQTGQLYMSNTDSQLYYYNGTRFVSLPNPDQTVNSIGGATGTVGVGQGLSIQGSQITNTGVLSVQGQTGAVTLTSGDGIAINGLAINNTGVTGLRGTVDQISVSQANGQVTLTLPQNIGINSSVTFGGLTLGNALPVSSGGTGATTAGGARGNLGAAASGANGDITSLSGLTTALSVAQGGTGVNGSSYNTSGVIYYDGTGFATTAPSADGLCLLSDAGGPYFGSCSGAASVFDVNGAVGNITINGDSGQGLQVTTDTGTSTISITVDDATATTKGVASFDLSNFDVVAGAVNTKQDINTSAAPTFAGLTVSGNAQVSGTLTVDTFSPVAGLNYTLDASATPGTYDICTTAATSLANCFSSGGGVTGTGTAGNIAKFTAAHTIADSLLTDDGTNVTVSSGNLIVQGGGLSVGGQIVVTSGRVLQNVTASTNILTSGTLGVARGGTGVASLNQYGVVIGNGGSGLTTADPGVSSSGYCLVSNGNAAAPSFQVCTGAGGVSSIIGTTIGSAALTTAITINNALTAAGAITIDTATDAATGGAATKGLASFKTGDFTATSGFVTLDTSVTKGGNAFNTANNLVKLDGSGNLPALNASALTNLSAANITGTVAIANGGTGASDAATARTNLGAAASGANNDITSLTALTAISPTAALTVGSASQNLILQGSGTTLSSSSGGFTTTVGFTTPTGNNSIVFPNAGGTVAVSGHGLITLDANGDITCPTCLSSGGGGGGGATAVTSLNTFTGDVTIQAGSGITITPGTNTLTIATSGSGITSLNGLTNSTLTINNASTPDSTHITIDNASVSQKGIAQFSSSDFDDNGSGLISLDTNVTKKGNSFNGNSQLVLLDVSGASNTSGQCLRSTGVGGTGAAFSTCPTGGNVSTGTTHTAGNLTKFDAGGINIVDSIASESGSTITVGGTLSATTLSGNGASVTNVNAAQLQGQNGAYYLDAGHINAGILGVGYGGTGKNSVTAGALLIGNGGSALNELTVGTNGQCLLVVSGAPAYGTCTGAGGVASVTGTANQVIVGGTSTNPILSLPQDINTTANVQFAQVTVSTVTSSGNLTIQPHTSSDKIIFNSGNLQVTAASPTLDLYNAAANTTLTILNSAAGKVANLSVSGSILNPTFTNGGTATYTFDAADTTAWQICTTAGNCSGAGSGVTATGATGGRLTKFTGTGNQITSSLLSEGSDTITLNSVGGTGTYAASADLVLQPGAGNKIVLASDTIQRNSSTLNFNLAGTGATTFNFTNPSTGGTDLASINVEANGIFGGYVQAATLQSAGALTLTSASGNDITLTPGGSNKVAVSSNLNLASGKVFSVGVANGVTNASNCTAGQVVTGVQTTGGIVTTTPACSSNSNTLQEAYVASTIPQITLNSTQGALTVRDASTPIGGNLLAVQNNGGGTTFFGVTATGIATSGTVNGATISSAVISGPAAFGITSGGSSDLTLTSGSGKVAVAATSIQSNAGLTLTTTGNAVNALAISTGNNGAGASGAITIDTGTASTTTGTITIGGTNASGVIVGKAPTASASAATLQLGSTAFAGGNASANGGTYLGINAPSSGAGSAADYLNFLSAGTSRFKVDSTGGVTSTGAALFKNASNSATAFMVQSATAANTLFTADTTNNRIIIGDKDNTSAANTTVLVLDNATTANAPTCGAATAGGLYYNTSNNVLMSCQGSSLAWTTFATSDLQAAYNNSSGTPASIVTTATNKGILFKAGSTFDSTALFDVQNSNSQSLLKIDSVSNNLNLLTSNPAPLSTWSTSSNSLYQPRMLAGGTYSNGYLYTLGGTCGGACSGSQTDVYYARVNSDGSTGTWAQTTALPGGTYTNAAVAYNGYIYSLGGTAGTAVYYAKQNADGTTGAWKTNPNPMNASRSGLAAAVANGYVYVSGGGNATTEYAKFNADGSIGTFTTGTSFTGSRAYHNMIYANGTLYIIGGNNSQWASVQSATVNSTTGAISAFSSNTAPSGGQGRERAGAGVINGYIYVFGGQIAGSSPPTSTVMYSKINSSGTLGAWTNDTNTLPGGTQRDDMAAAVANGYIYMLGSDNDTGNGYSNVYYASAPRISAAGTLDLVGTEGGTLSYGGTGSSLTAGNTQVVGTFQVQEQASFAGSLSVNGVLSAAGSVAFQNTSNSTTAFQIQNAGVSSTLFTADTTNNLIKIGDNTGTTTAVTTFVLDKAAGGAGNATGPSCATSTLGGLYYNTDLNLIQACQGSSPAWGTLGATTLQGAYDATSGTPATITTASSSKSILFKAGASADSTALFDVQNSSSQSLLKVDSTVSGNVKILNNNSNLGAWTTAGNLFYSREYASGVAVNGYIYSIGGVCYGGSCDGGSSATDVYYTKVNSDGSPGTWAKLSGATLPVQRWAAGAVTANGYIYLLGGTNGTTKNDYYYAKINGDGTLGAWTLGANTFSARQNQSVATANGYIYMTGGNSSGTAQSSIQYAKINGDGSLGSWTNAATTAGARDKSMSFIANGYIYVTGGYSGGMVLTTYSAPLDPTTGAPGSWTAQTSIPSPGIHDTTATVVNGTVYLIGGKDSSTAINTTTYAKIGANGTISGSWATSAGTSTGSLPANRQGGLILNMNGYIYEMGGDDNTGNGYNNSYYLSTTRLSVGGTLDLVGTSTGSGQDYTNPGGGGALVAGNTNIIGALQVQDQSRFASSLAIGRNLSVSGSTSLQSDSTTTLQVQNAAGTSNLFVADTINAKIGIGALPTSGGQKLQVTGGINTTVGLYTGSGGTGTLRVDNNGQLQNVSFGSFGGSTGAGALVVGANGAVSLATGTAGSQCLLWSANTAAPTFNTCPSGSGSWLLTGNNATGSILGSTGTAGNNAAFVISSAPNGNTAGANSSNSYIQFTGNASSNPNRIIIAGNANSNSPQGGGSYSSGNTADYFRIQDSAGNVAFAVQGNGGAQQVFAYLSSGSSVGINSRVCSGLSPGGSGMATLATCTTSGTDLAESYNSTQQLTPGDIVATDGSSYPNTIRSDHAGQDNLMGVIATNPDYVMGTQVTPDGYPVALSGRVPTKVNAEGGAIHAGDKITSSSVAGVGKKATGPGMIVGTALTDYTGSGQGSIELFIHLSYYDPTSGHSMQGGQNGDFGDLNVSGNATLASLHVTGNSTFDGSITVNGHIITGGGAPTITAGTNAGTGATATVTGNDTLGTITVTAGSGAAAGELAKIVFNKTYGAAPKVLLTPSNAAAATLQFYRGASSTTSASVNAGVAPTDGGVYEFDYFIGQ